MMNRTLYLTLLALIPLYSFSQSNNLTGSPYSLFGLGVNTSSNIGKNSALGNGGYALSGDVLINNANPASYGSFFERTFIFDFGFLAEISNIANRSSEERRFAGNFSNLAIASSIDSKSSFGLSIVPYTDVGYSLIGIERNIEGSVDQFISSVTGTGSINDFRLSYGRSITDRLRVGANLSYLFGSIEESEFVLVEQSTLEIIDQNTYNGFRFGLGLQFDFNDKIGFGFVTNLPTSLSGESERDIQKTLDFVPAIVEDESNSSVDDFDLPMEVNTGIVFKPKKNVAINLDYSVRFWNATDQRDNLGEFIDQYIFAVGGEYFIDKDSFKFWEQIRFRAGFNYDTGYLSINDNSINSFSVTAGLGIPLGNRSRSKINISYGYTNRGDTGGILVEEKFSTININMSLKDIWFLKRKLR
ncbi:MAG: hypothetical protein AAFZ89_05095 [Bacteroidota bacterium]